nr:hypothetical protein [Ruficoccus amylovorans]
MARTIRVDSENNTLRTGALAYGQDCFQFTGLTRGIHILVQCRDRTTATRTYSHDSHRIVPSIRKPEDSRNLFFPYGSRYVQARALPLETSYNISRHDKQSYN